MPQPRTRTLNGASGSHKPADEIALPSTLLDITPQQAGTQTLLRGLAILEAAAAGVRDLRTFGAALGTTRSTTHRLVSSLVQARYLRQVQGGYLLGPKLIELGTIALEQMPLTAVARQHLESLAEQTLDTIHLGVRDGDDVLYIDKIPGTRGLEMRSRVGHRMPLASTGIGKAMMLDLTPDAWQSLFDASRRALAGVSFKPDNRPDMPTFMQRMTNYSARRLHVRPRRKRGVDPLRRGARARRVGCDRRGAVGGEHDSLYVARADGRTDSGRAARSARHLGGTRLACAAAGDAQDQTMTQAGSPMPVAKVTDATEVTNVAQRRECRRIANARRQPRSGRAGCARLGHDIIARLSVRRSR